MVIQGGKAASRTGAASHASVHAAERRHMLPANVLAAAISLLVLAVGGCATYKPTAPPSKGPINRDHFPEKAADDKILAPVTTSKFVPLPQPQVQVTTCT